MLMLIHGWTRTRYLRLMAICSGPMSNFFSFIPMINVAIYYWSAKQYGPQWYVWSIKSFSINVHPTESKYILSSSPFNFLCYWLWCELGKKKKPLTPQTAYQIKRTWVIDSKGPVDFWGHLGGKFIRFKKHVINLKVLNFI